MSDVQVRYLSTGARLVLCVEPVAAGDPEAMAAMAAAGRTAGMTANVEIPCWWWVRLIGAGECTMAHGIGPGFNEAADAAGEVFEFFLATLEDLLHGQLTTDQAAIREVGWQQALAGQGVVFVDVEGMKGRDA